ncbi:MAG: HIT domain-containing protein [Actinomycetota bacterium]|nr:HIT domain-containing protein [Actinomycetota bacterium]
MSRLDRLWAGWRGEYVEGLTGEAAPAAAPEGCIFCAILAGDAPDEETYVLWRDPSGLAAAILNAYPYGSGHLMVMPVRHCASPEDLSGQEGVALWAAITDAVRAVRRAYSPDGLNVGANLGRAAGAGIPDHLHMHVLPRWSGDTNFMTAVAETRVLPEPLHVTYGKLRATWPR